mmetsp:Transcript_5483/g.16750  ORF Transcript_5483/g.16750 Transcript_5483/m.16750 type:complete len:374 (-) Transcript_5483:643-1764(-)
MIRIHAFSCFSYTKAHILNRARLDAHPRLLIDAFQIGAQVDDHRSDVVRRAALVGGLAELLGDVRELFGVRSFPVSRISRGRCGLLLLLLLLLFGGQSGEPGAHQRDDLLVGEHVEETVGGEHHKVVHAGDQRALHLLGEGAHERLERLVAERTTGGKHTLYAPHAQPAHKAAERLDASALVGEVGLVVAAEWLSASVAAAEHRTRVAQVGGGEVSAHQRDADGGAAGGAVRQVGEEVALGAGKAGVEGVGHVTLAATAAGRLALRVHVREHVGEELILGVGGRLPAAVPVEHAKEADTIGARRGVVVLHVGAASLHAGHPEAGPLAVRRLLSFAHHVVGAALARVLREHRVYRGGGRAARGGVMLAMHPPGG